MSLLSELGLDPNDFDWTDLALCQGMVPIVTESGDIIDNFFDTYESNPEVAKAVDECCLACPVRLDCLAQGQSGEYGLWGGIYWNGSGKPDQNRNKHKTPEVWEAIRKGLTG